MDSINQIQSAEFISLLFLDDIDDVECMLKVRKKNRKESHEVTNENRNEQATASECIATSFYFI